MGAASPAATAEETAPSEGAASPRLSSASRERTRRRQRHLRLLGRWASPVLLCAALLTMLALSASHTDRLLEWVRAGLTGLRALGPYSPLVAIGLQLLVMLLVMPTWPLWLCGGAAFTALWGQLLGLAVAFGTLAIGVWLGSVLAFCVGRTALRPCIAECSARRPLFRAIDLAVERRGLQLGLLLKMSPLMHTSLANYVLAATRMRLCDFALSCVGSFLPMSVWIFAGASVSSLAQLDAHAHGGGADVRRAISPGLRALMTALTLLGGALALCALVVVTRASRRAYAEILASGAPAATAEGSEHDPEPRAAGRALLGGRSAGAGSDESGMAAALLTAQAPDDAEGADAGRVVAQEARAVLGALSPARTPRPRSAAAAAAAAAAVTSGASGGGSLTCGR